MKKELNNKQKDCVANVVTVLGIGAMLGIANLGLLITMGIGVASAIGLIYLNEK